MVMLAKRKAALSAAFFWAMVARRQRWPGLIVVDWYVAMGAMPSVTEGAHVIRFCVLVVSTGATLQSDAWVVVRLFGEGCGEWEVMDAGAGGDVTGCGGVDFVMVGSVGGVGMLLGHDVCWRMMLLSWSSWWRWLSEMGDRGEKGEGDNNARVGSWAAAMAIPVDEWRGIIIVLGNQVRVSEIRSELVAQAQTR
jgi:hypothetical protein